MTVQDLVTAFAEDLNIEVYVADREGSPSRVAKAVVGSVNSLADPDNKSTFVVLVPEVY